MPRDASSASGLVAFSSQPRKRRSETSARNVGKSVTRSARSREEDEMYVRINHLTINEDVEVYELCEEDGTVVDFGTEDEMNKKLFGPGSEIDEALFARSLTNVLMDFFGYQREESDDRP